MLTIGQVAKRAGIRTSTMRYYEDIGLLSPPVRVSGQRRYDEGIFQRLAMIKLAQRAGLTIAEIHTLLEEFPEDIPPVERWRRLLYPKLADIQELMQRLQDTQRMLERMLGCQCDSMDECAARAANMNN